MEPMTIEWAPFRLAEGATESELLEASAALQADFLESQDGFVRRELLRGAGDQWCDLVYWRDASAAQRAMEAAAASHTCTRYFRLMAGAEEAANGVLHFAVRASYGN